MCKKTCTGFQWETKKRYLGITVLGWRSFILESIQLHPSHPGLQSLFFKTKYTNQIQ